MAINFLGDLYIDDYSASIKYYAKTTYHIETHKYKNAYFLSHIQQQQAIHIVLTALKKCTLKNILKKI